MYLVFDTETTGLPRSWNAPKSDLANWPRIVQIAWATFDEQQRPMATRSFLVRPDGFTIPDEATRVHGISTARASKEGVALSEALAAFSQALVATKVVVAHNLEYDETVVGAEFARAQLAEPFGKRRRICTMKESTDLCAIPAAKGFK